ncbi:MAG TPA: malto-oligosyltrehalose trehalohydrolase [Verrucomicrobiae bacterium]|nr:malto-oligosyltrehalose trehalohydrolase [Verrucomicrobiae bacterium]
MTNSNGTGTAVLDHTKPAAQAEHHAGLSDLPLGAQYLGNGRCSICVWAPRSRRVTIAFSGGRTERLQPQDGYHWSILDDIAPGAEYQFRLDDGDPRPDPASRFQVDSVHGPSAVADPEFEWHDPSWLGLPLRDYLLYELHVGTFTREGTFEAIIPRLAELKELGVTAIELMPIAQFPGSRNWGYDGVFPFAVQNSYGGPAGLKRLVDACHQHQLAVVLDVVYNHLGPEGNYLRDFGPYFTMSYKTPWGEAINFDGEESDHVRRFFTENALYWQREFHIDALRLDAVHAIRDFSAQPFLQELANTTRAESQRLNRRFHLIAESDLNDARLIRPAVAGGFGLDAQWSDDFHHCLHVLLTGECDGYYADFGGTAQLAKIFRNGYAFTGDYSAFRKRRHGNRPTQTSARQFVVYSQNHDQIGNRFLGERLTELVSFERLKLAAGAVVLSPFLPMLFMGEEYGEPAPFQYFVSHTDPALVEAVRKGRLEEFGSFKRKGDVPDPFAVHTFDRCRLDWELRNTREKHGVLWDFYRELIQIRKSLKPICDAEKESIDAHAVGEGGLLVRYNSDTEVVMLALNFSDSELEVSLDGSGWIERFNSAAEKWRGPGGLAFTETFARVQPASFVVLQSTVCQ